MLPSYSSASYSILYLLDMFSSLYICLWWSSSSVVFIRIKCFYFYIKMDLVMITETQRFVYFNIVNVFMLRRHKSNTFPPLVGFKTCWVRKQSCVRSRNWWSSPPTLSNDSHCIWPWLKSPIITYSPLLNSLKSSLQHFKVLNLPPVLRLDYDKLLLLLMFLATMLHQIASSQSA